MAFEENEISKKSQGGTEQMKRGLAERLPEGLTNEFQIICSRVRDLDPEKIRVYWLHDLPEDPETNHLKDQWSRSRFHKLVFCGQWQYQQYMTKLGVPYNTHATVIETAIDPIPYVDKSKDEIRLIYTSTPQRGLNILVPVFEKLAEKYPNIHLDVFSSYKIYGWDDADKQFEPLYERCRNHPQITYHGHQPNEVVREALQKAHIFAYPCTWTECNSRSLIEAMSAGCLAVHPNWGGLTDTSGGLTFQYHGSEDLNVHAQIFINALENAINVVNKDEVQSYLKFVKSYADTRYNWTKITQQWTELLKNLELQFVDKGSRKIISGPTFQYKTA